MWNVEQMFALQAKPSLSRKLWMERGQWSHCEMGASVDDKNSGNQGNERVCQVRLQTAMYQMQVQRCTAQLHTPLLMFL